MLALPKKLDFLRLCLAWACILLAATYMSGTAAIAAEQPRLGQLKGCGALEEKAPDGAFVLYLAASEDWGACNPVRARKRFLPASTYKVPHALIGLETGVIEDENAKLKWDGVKRVVPAWNADTSLASGMRNSTVWFYQDMARRIGWETMTAWVRKLDYGNMDIGEARDIDSFWLTGALRITAIEEVRFLDRLRRKQLPASEANQEKVIRMMTLERSKENARTSWVMHGKTGAILPISGDKGDIVKGDKGAGLLDGLDRIGWLVGWIERPESQGGDAVFALNLSLDSPAALGLRKPLVHELLAANGVLPASNGN